MTFLRKYSLILGLCILIGVIVLLLTSSDIFFSSGVKFIDTNPAYLTGDEVYVKTKMNFGSREHMAEFPHQIDKWAGYDYDTSEWEELLGTDIMLMRGYTAPDVYQPVFFLIMQSKTETSFHPPDVCYTSQGYKIQEESKDKVFLTNTSWAEQSSVASVPVAKMVITKESDDAKVTERRVVLYFYVKGNQFTTDTITWVRMEAVAPTEGSYDEVLNAEKDLLDQAFPLMFDPAEDGGWRPIGRELADKGIIGYLAIVIMLSIPLAIMVFPKTRWGRG